MSESIIKGYVINRVDYKITDEIITFVDECSVKHTCLSLGSKKTTSKNSRNLFLGNFCEFQVFMARDINKLSKLKKCIAVKTNDWNLQLSPPFNLIFECATKSIHSSNLFIFIKKLLKLIKEKKYSEQEIILIILHKFCLINGLNLEVNKCVVCGNKKIKTISFKKMGLVCNIHYDKSKDYFFSRDITKLFHYLFNNEYDYLHLFNEHYRQAIKILLDFVSDSIGINLYSICRV